MADFCKQCSIATFGEDFGDLKGLGNGEVLPIDHGWLCLCEGCGTIIVDDEGNCISKDCLENGHLIVSGSTNDKT